MRKELKILLLILLFNFVGCNPKNCDLVPKYLNIQGLEITVKKIDKTYQDGSFSTLPFDTNNSINFSDLVLEITPVMRYYGHNKSFTPRNFLINSAYAGKCPLPGFKGSTEQIAGIIIFSNEPFLASGSPADTLSYFFDISGLDDRNGFIAPIDLMTFISTQPSVMREICLNLKVRPRGSHKHKFTILYKQTNGEFYEMTTPTIKFN